MDPSTGLSRETVVLRQRLLVSLVSGDKMFAPVLGEEVPGLTHDRGREDDTVPSVRVKAEPVYDEAQTPNFANDNGPVASAMQNSAMHQTDDLIQADIREQNTVVKADPDYDPFASEDEFGPSAADEFPDIVDLLDREEM